MTNKQKLRYARVESGSEFGGIDIRSPRYTTVHIDTQTKHFLSILHRGGEWAYWWTLPEKVTTWWPAGELTSLPNGKTNTYFGVHPTICKKSSKQRAKIADIAAVNCLFAEFDAKHYAEKVDLGKKAALTHINNLAVIPSVLIDSGGGYHAYWLLSETFILNSASDRERVKDLQAAWVQFTNADGNAKDLVRVLRVPGTINYKPAYEPNYPIVKFYWADLDLRHDMAALESLALNDGKQPQKLVDVRHSKDTRMYWLKQALLKSSNGNRNETGFWLACQLRDAGLIQSETKGVMRTYAQGVSSGDHPYTEEEALASVRSVYTQSARVPAQRKWDKVSGNVIDAGENLGVLDNDPLNAEKDIPELPGSVQLPDNLGKDACPWLDAYIEFSRKWSPRSFDGFHEATALWLLSTVAARRICFHFGKPRFTNLYIMLGGRTTLHAKSSATDIGRQTLKACGLNFLLAPDESTPQSFIKYLADDIKIPSAMNKLPEDVVEKIVLRLAFKGQVGWYAEEFGSWLASMLRADGIMADFRGLLRIFDDCPPQYSRSTIARNIEVVEKPYLAMIANLTPADLKPLARKGSQLWGDGFLARFAFITPHHDDVLSGKFPHGERIIPARILTPIMDWHNRLGIPDVFIDEKMEEYGQTSDKTSVSISLLPVKTLEISEPVRETFYRYHDAVSEIARDSDMTDLDGNYGRLGEKALRIAALFASLEGNDEINPSHWARAQEIVERWRVYTHRLYHQVIKPDHSDFARTEDLILGVLRRHTGKEKYLQGMTANDVRRFMHGMSRIEVKDYLQRLVKVGVVTIHNNKRAKRYSLAEECRGEKVEK